MQPITRSTGANIKRPEPHMKPPPLLFSNFRNSQSGPSWSTNLTPILSFKGTYAFVEKDCSNFEFIVHCYQNKVWDHRCVPASQCHRIPDWVENVSSLQGVEKPNTPHYAIYARVVLGSCTCTDREIRLKWSRGKLLHPLLHLHCQRNSLLRSRTVVQRYSQTQNWPLESSWVITD
jgi:hypothetical protein